MQVISVKEEDAEERVRWRQVIHSSEHEQSKREEK